MSVDKEFIKALNEGLDSVGDQFRNEINEVRSEVNQLKAVIGKNTETQKIIGSKAIFHVPYGLINFIRIVFTGFEHDAGV